MKTVFSLAAVFLSLAAMAQDETKKIDVNINMKSSNWYESPWVWVVGAAVFILLLVALTRGGGRKE